MLKPYVLYYELIKINNRLKYRIIHFRNGFAVFLLINSKSFVNCRLVPPRTKIFQVQAQNNMEIKITDEINYFKSYLFFLLKYLWLFKIATKTVLVFVGSLIPYRDWKNN